jgi:hypothetical protein
LLDADKVETRLPIASLEDIYQFADEIRAIVHRLRDSGAS